MYFASNFWLYLFHVVLHANCGLHNFGAQFFNPSSQPPNKKVWRRCSEVRAAVFQCTILYLLIVYRKDMRLLSETKLIRYIRSHEWRQSVTRFISSLCSKDISAQVGGSFALLCCTVNSDGCHRLPRLPREQSVPRSGASSLASRSKKSLESLPTWRTPVCSLSLLTKHCNQCAVALLHACRILPIF